METPASAAPVTAPVTEPTASGERSDPSVILEPGQTPAQENTGVTTSLFGETYSEADLMGLVEEGAPTGETPAQPLSTGEPPAQQPSPAATTKAPETPPASTEGPSTPPQVPLPALHEERGKRQAATARAEAAEARAAELERQIAEFQSGNTQTREATPPRTQEPSSALPDDFKVLSADEFRDLAETDVVESQIYLHNLETYKEEQRKQAAQAEAVKRMKDVQNQIVERRFAEMEEAVPGILADAGELNGQLTEFAATHGLEPDILGIFTNPGTRIVQEDGRVVVLGKGAVQMLKLVHSLYRNGQPNPDAQRAAADKEAQIKTQAAAEVINKLKTEDGGYRSIGETPPGGSSVPLDPDRILTETELAALSEAEQRRYLGG